MSSANLRTCPICETAIPLGFPSGMCPKCLINGAAPENEADQKDLDISAPHSAADAPTVEALRRLFPDLEIIAPLGAGGMGAVYKARQTRLDRFVALKIMTCKPGHEADFGLRFEREAQVLARLSHPHIVIIYDFGEVSQTDSDGGQLFYFLMEYVDGTDLAQLIRAGEMKAPQALAIVPQICEALQYAHDQGITHRDIKPANILIDQRGVVKIADFGLAKMADGEVPSLATGLTLTGTTLGTPHYMAPEQWENPDLVDHRADIYALGVVFYEMLTGERPAGVFEPPSKKSPMDKRLDGVVLRAMERNPDRRYQQASQIKSDVSRISTSRSSRRAEAASQDGKRHSSGFKKLYGLGFGAIMLAGSWFYLHSSSEHELNQEPLPRNVSAAPQNAQPSGHLKAAGFTNGGQPHDLSKFAPYDDFIDVIGGWYDWTALRSNGQTISSDGKNDYSGIRRIVRGLIRTYAFINNDGHLIVPRNFPIPTPEALTRTQIIDAAFGRDHGIVLTPEGTAIPYGKRYEENIGDWSDPTQWDTPRWPAPPEHALHNVIDIAVTSTHAATLNQKGEVSLWGWEGLTTWAPEPNIKRIINIESDDDTLLLLDEAGQVWTYYLPRSPSASKIVFFDRKLKYITSSAVDLRERFWRHQNGTWQSIRSEANFNLSDTPLPPDSAFSVSTGFSNGKPLTSLLWIEPKTASLPPFTDREAAEWALTSAANSRPWAGGEDISVIVQMDDGSIKKVRSLNDLPSSPFVVTRISCVPADEQENEVQMTAHITDDQVQRLTQLRHLTELHLRGNTTNRLLDVLAHLPNLKKVSLSASQLTDADLASFKDAPYTFLRFFGLTVREPTALDVLRTMPDLRFLVLDGTLDLTTAKGLPSLPTLENFHSTHNEWLTDDVLPVLIEKFPNLTAISLDHCRNFKGRSLNHLHQWPRLRSVRLTDSPVDDMAVTAFKEIPNLTTLELGYSRITDSCLPALLSLPLIELDVSETRLTDTAILQLAQISSLKKLSATSYRSTTTFTPAGVDAFVKARPDVVVSRSPATLNETFVAFPGGLTSMGSLRSGKPIDLSKAEGITDFTQVVLHDKGWIALRSNGQTLSSDGRGERKKIVKICPGIDSVFALIDSEDHVEVFARLESSEDLNTTLPAGIQQIGVVELLSDGHHSLALLKDGTARSWGNHYDNPGAVPEWIGRDPWLRPPSEALSDVKSIAITPLSASTVTADGHLWTWGKASDKKFPVNAAALQGQYASLISSNSGLYDALAHDGRRISFNLSTGEAQVGAPGIVSSAYGGYRPLHQRKEGFWSTAWNRPEFRPYFDAVQKRPASSFSLMFFHEGDDQVSIGLITIDPET